MDVHSFASYYSSIRDHGLTLKQSWCTRFGDEGNCPEHFELWTLVPLEHLTADDILWALVAAALDRTASHLVLYVFTGSCTDPEAKVCELEQELRSQGFLPYGLDWQFDDETGEKALLFSVFSEDEAYRIQDLYFRN